jgi:DNA-binding MarR family transcriptional regulator
MKTDHDNSPLTDQDVAKILLDWSSVFMRRSMHDFMAYTRTNSISMPQINVLMWLYYHKCCEVMQLEEVMQVSRPAASQMVERMVQQGLVNRTESPTDRRSRLVTLSDRGIAFIEEAIAARRRWLSNLVETFSPEQKNTVALALKLLSEHAIEMDQNTVQ